MSSIVFVLRFIHLNAKPHHSSSVRSVKSVPFSLASFLSPSFMDTEVPRNDTCPELPEITNGWKSTSHPELVHGTVVTYQCYPGFQLVGTELLMCQWDLTWSGDLPSCERGDYHTHTGTQKVHFRCEKQFQLRTG